MIEIRSHASHWLGLGWALSELAISFSDHLGRRAFSDGRSVTTPTHQQQENH